MFAAVSSHVILSGRRWILCRENKSMMILCSLKVLYFHTLQTMHLPLGLHFHLSSLLPFLKNNNNRMGMTPQHFHTILSNILGHFDNYAHHKTLYVHIDYSHPLNEHSTQHCSLHSLPHRRQPDVPCPAAEFPNIT